MAVPKQNSCHEVTIITFRTMVCDVSLVANHMLSEFSTECQTIRNNKADVFRFVDDNDHMRRLLVRLDQFANEKGNGLLRVFIE